jgi:hypothetical protein
MEVPNVDPNSLGIALVRWLAGLQAGLVAILACQSPPAVAQEMVIAPQFELAGLFHHGSAPAQENGRWGLINTKGDWTIRPTFTQIGPGGDGLFPFQEDGKWGFIDAKGKERVSAQFDEARPFDDGFAPVKSKGRWGLLRTDGTLLVDFRFDEISGHSAEFLAARDGQEWGLYTSAGEFSDSSQSLAVDLKHDNSEEGWINPTRLYSISDGAVVAAYVDGERLYDIRRWKPRYDEDVYASVRRRSEGFAAARTKTGSGWGFIVRSGEFVWDGRFEDAMIFSEGLAPVKSGGKWGYIAKSGDFVLQPQYDAAYPFRNGFAVIRTEDKRGFLKNDDQRGVLVFVEPRYDDASGFSDGLAAVKVGDKWGYISSGESLVQGDIVELKPQ